jgi:hypothetical protein
MIKNYFRVIIFLPIAFLILLVLWFCQLCFGELYTKEDDIV